MVDVVVTIFAKMIFHSGTLSVSCVFPESHTMLAQCLTVSKQNAIFVKAQPLEAEHPKLAF